MILFAYILGSLALGMGTGLVILALLKLETREDLGRVSEGWLRRVHDSDGTRDARWDRS